MPYPLPPRPTRSRQAAASPVASGHAPLTLAMSVAACFSLPAVALAQATQASGLQAIHGAASMVTQGHHTLITTHNGAGTSHSALNWQSFGVAPGATTHFAQPSAASTSINRVLGHNPSAIFGTLSSNGRLVLVNPAGIAVGAGAVVDTAGFTASTLRMSDADAIAGRLVFGDGGIAGGVNVQGHIVARGGDVVLIAPDVQTGTGAVIESADGATVLAAGRKVEVTGRGLEGIRLQVQAPQDAAVNLGQLKGDAVGIFAGTLKHNGLIQATAVSVEGGKVVLKGQDSADIAGSTTARRGSLGGQVHATAGKVMLRSGAVIDVSGAAGGGEALVGGGWQGKDARISNASETAAEAGATINADATVHGHGGTVVIWSDGATRTQAQVQARGGVAGGDGGKLETSGKQFLDTTAVPQLNARAAGGKPGEWLLDPQEIVIGSGTPTAPSPAPNTYSGYNSGGASYVSPATIQTALNAGTSVTIQTSGPAIAPAPNETSIRVAENVSMTGTGPATLNLYAHQNIQLDNNVTIGSTSGALNLNFKAGWSADAATASSTGGSILLTTGSRLNSNGGTIVMTAQGTASTPGEAIQMSQATIASAGGAVTLNGTHASVNRRAIALDRSLISSGAGAIALGSTTSNIRLWGSSLTSTGGNITLSTAGAHNYSALEIVEYGGPPAIASLVSTSGSGNISLSGELTNFGSSAGSFAGGVAISGSTVSAGSGAITINGKVGAPSGVAQVSRGFSIDGGARVTGAGAIGITGEVGASASAGSMGGIVASGTTVVSSGGAISLSGTLNNASISAGTGLSVGGTVQAATQLTLAGSATVGNSAGTGLDITSGAVLSSGSLGLTATGTVSSSTTATAIVGTSVAGSVTSSGNISMAGTVSAPSSVGPIGLRQTGGGIAGTGSATIMLTGSGVPAPAPASYRDLDLSGTVSTAGGEIKLVGDRIGLNYLVNSAAGRTMIVPFSANRAITLGGSDETTALNLTSSELNNITASTLVVGGGTYTGGIGIAGSIAPSGVSALSLINHPTGANGITQSGSTAITIGSLNADARYVSLNELGNSIGTLSGRNYAGTFDVATSGALTIGTVDGIAGLVASTTGGISVQAGGALTVNNDVTASSATVALSGNGILLGGTRTISGTGVSLGGGGGALALGVGSLSSTGAIQLNNAAGVTLGNVSAASGGLSLTNLSGNVVQQGGTTVNANTLSGSALGGTVNLTESGNAFNFIGTLSTSGGGLSVLDDSGDLSITGAVSAANGTVKIRTAGSLTQAQTITAGGAGDAIVLSAINSYTNSVGAAALAATHGSGRWIIYSNGPGGNAFNNLASGNNAVWNATYALNAPGTIAAGNRYVFAQQPTATIVANAQTREYDGGTSFAPVTHSVTGLINASTYGNVFSQDALTGSLAVTSPGRNVGSYAIGMGTLAAPTGYAVNFTPANASVTAKALTLTAVTDSRVYNGTTSSSGVPTFVGLVGGDSLTGLSQSYASKNVLGANGSTLHVNGGYTLSDGNGGNNYSVTLLPTTGTITPAALTVSTSNVNRQYDSTTNAAGSAVVTGGTLFSGDTLSGGVFSFASKNVGTNVTVNVSGVTVADGNGGANYTLTQAANTTSNITAAPVTVTGVTATNRIYDGTSVASLGGTATVSHFGTDDLGVSGTGVGTFATKHVGTGKTVNVSGFTLTGADAGNYTIVQPVGVAADISAKAVTFRPNDFSRVYDGTTSATGATLSITSGSVMGGDTPIGGTLSFTDRHAGTGKTVNLTGLTINDGNGGNNYIVSFQPNNTSTITPANLAVTGVSATSRVYDATTVASLGGSATVAALGGDSVTLGGTGSGSFADRHAGNSKPVAVTGYTLSGPNAGNYVLVQPAGVTANITPAPLTVSTTSVNRQYDGTTNAAGSLVVTAGALQGSDTLSGGTFQFVSKNAGSNVTVNVGGTTVNDGNGGLNYALTQTPNTTSNITQAPLAVTGLTATSRVYDGTTVASLAGVAAVTGIGTDVVSVLGAGSATFADRHVGVAKPVTVGGFGLTGADAGNYAIVQPTGLSADITPASLTVNGVSAANKVYDGTTAATLTGTPSVTFLGGDSASITGAAVGTFANRNAATGKPVTVTGYTLTGAHAGNYTLVQPTGLTANISPAPLTLKPQDVSRAYDGTTAATGTLAVVSGALMGGDTLGTGTLAFTDRHVGTGKTVNLSSAVLNDGNGGNNYTVTYQANTSSTITQRALSTWTGTAGDHLWSNPANWDALPDLANVLAVSIPSGASVIHDLAGTTSLQTLTSAGSLALAAGTLSMGGALSTAGYNQTGGALTGAGSLTVSDSFTRTAGSLSLGGGVNITQATGNLVAGGITAGSVSLTAANGHITQNGAIHTMGGLVTAQARDGIALNDAGNQFAALYANNTAAGNIDVTNGVALDLQKAVTANGNVTVVSTGGISTSGPVAANGGTLSMTSNSPLTIGTNGASAMGNVTLTATNATSAGNMVLNGPVSSSTGAVSLNAAGTLTQNGAVSGPAGVSATSGGATTFGASASTSGTPISYTAAGSPVTPPAPPAPAPGPATPPPPPPAVTPPPPGPAPTPTPPPPPAVTPPPPASPPPPAPPPAPAPTPAAAPVVDSIVAILNDGNLSREVSRAEIAEVIQQVDNTVTQFVALLVKEEAKQQEEAADKKKKDDAKDIAVIDGNQCKN